MMISLARLMVEGRPDDHPVALREGTVINFKALRLHVRQAAAKVRPGTKVVLACHDSYSFVVGLFGLMHGGADIILPPNLQPATLLSLKESYDLLADDAWIEASADTPETATADLVSLDLEKPCLSFFTSGSTGTPKAVPKTLGMFEREVLTLERLWGMHDDPSNRTTFFATVSHQHVFGFTFKLLWPLMSGRAFTAATHLFWDDLIADLTADAIIISSPAHLSRLDGLTPLHDHKPLRIFSAGAALPPKAAADAKAVFGCPLTEIFGSTETGAIANRVAGDGQEAWHLLPGIVMRCDDAQRLMVQSPFVGTEWVTTGDRVEKEGDGFRHLGRGDRIAKIEGARVSLIEIEKALEALPEVKSAAVVVLSGTPAYLGAVVTPSDQGFQFLEKMGNFRFGRILRDRLSSAHEPAGIPRLWRFVESLPSGSMGKRRDDDIRALFDEK